MINHNLIHEATKLRLFFKETTDFKDTPRIPQISVWGKGENVTAFVNSIDILSFVCAGYELRLVYSYPGIHSYTAFFLKEGTLFLNQ